jgi:hypothetical protein
MRAETENQFPCNRVDTPHRGTLALVGNFPSKGNPKLLPCKIDGLEISQAWADLVKS